MKSWQGSKEISKALLDRGRGPCCLNLAQVVMPILCASGGDVELFLERLDFANGHVALAAIAFGESFPVF